VLGRAGGGGKFGNLLINLRVNGTLWQRGAGRRRGKGHGEMGEAEVESGEGVRSEMLQVWPTGGVLENEMWKESLHARRGRKRRQRSACVRFAS
jgi:hypothetical protein